MTDFQSLKFVIDALTAVREAESWIEICRSLDLCRMCDRKVRNLYCRQIDFRNIEQRYELLDTYLGEDAHQCCYFSPV